jgi:hypothetical protein
MQIPVRRIKGQILGDGKMTRSIQAEKILEDYKALKMKFLRDVLRTCDERKDDESGLMVLRMVMEERKQSDQLTVQMASELIHEVEESRRKTAAKFVHNKDNNTIMIFDRPQYGGYEVDLDRIKSPLDLLSWVRQMNEKVWFDREMMDWFLFMVCEIKGWQTRN